MPSRLHVREGSKQREAVIGWEGGIQTGRGRGGGFASLATASSRKHRSKNAILGVFANMSDMT